MNALKGQDIREKLLADVSHEALKYWPKSTQQNASVKFGHILYLTKIVKDFEVMARGKSGGMLSSAFTRSLRSPRRFLGTNLGLQSFPLGDDVGKLVRKDGLRICLTPKMREDQSEKPTVLLPDLEIGIAINQAQRTTELGSVRLVFKKREADLLMPDQIADLRFSTEIFATANTLSGVPQELGEFLASSNLEVWGTGRLKTPPGLRLPIPRYSTSEASSKGSAKSQVALSEFDPVSPIYVDYTFASLEHRSELVELRPAHDLVYSIIEAGRTGGRREELSVVVQRTGSKHQGISLYEVAQNLITKSQSGGSSHDPGIRNSKVAR